MGTRGPLNPLGAQAPTDRKQGSRMGKAIRPRLRTREETHGIVGSNQFCHKGAGERRGEKLARAGLSAHTRQQSSLGFPTSGSDVQEACVVLEPEDGDLFLPIPGLAQTKQYLGAK